MKRAGSDLIIHYSEELPVERDDPERAHEGYMGIGSEGLKCYLGRQVN